MACYAVSWQTEIDVSALTLKFGLTAKQIEVLQRYNGIDLSYENANHCSTLVEFANAMNEVSMPEMDIEYSLLDEDGFETSISFDKQVNKYVLASI